MWPPLASTIAIVAAGFAMAVLTDGAHQNEVTQTIVQAQLRGAADCVCRAAGRTFEVGETACLQTPEGPRLAECGMVLNNTSWRLTESPCLEM